MGRSTRQRNKQGKLKARKQTLKAKTVIWEALKASRFCYDNTMKTKVIATNLELPKALIDSLEGAELQPAALVGEDGNYKPAEKSVRSSHVAWLH